MTVRFHRIGEGDVDHERLWGWVLLVTILAALAVFAVPNLRPVVACPLKSATGLACPTCGVTRSIVALGHGDVGHALRLHPATPPLALALGVYVPYALVVSSVGLARVRLRVSPGEARFIRGVVITFTAALWAFLIADGR